MLLQYFVQQIRQDLHRISLLLHRIELRPCLDQHRARPQVQIKTFRFQIDISRKTRILLPRRKFHLKMPDSASHTDSEDS